MSDRKQRSKDLFTSLNMFKRFQAGNASKSFNLKFMDKGKVDVPVDILFETLNEYWRAGNTKFGGVPHNATGCNQVLQMDIDCQVFNKINMEPVTLHDIWEFIKLNIKKYYDIEFKPNILIDNNIDDNNEDSDIDNNINNNENTDAKEDINIENTNNNEDIDMKMDDTNNENTDAKENVNIENKDIAYIDWCIKHNNKYTFKKHIYCFFKIPPIQVKQLIKIINKNAEEYFKCIKNDKQEPLIDVLPGLLRLDMFDKFVDKNNNMGVYSKNTHYVTEYVFVIYVILLLFEYI